jgi:CRISPR/Cas system CMR subunit Cmr4 (Cas7 group RAMP superfamily)
LAAVDNNILNTVTEKLKELQVLQFGGDETIGLGYCSIKVM